MKQAPDGVHWLPKEEYDKAVGQLERQLTGVFDPFHNYGQDVYILGAIAECVKLAEDFGLRVRGIDKEIALDLIRRKNGRLVD